jgi:hypothetical protein
MSLLKHISNFIIEKVLPIKFKVWLLDRLACDIASQGEDGDTELAHINSYEAKLLKSVGGSGTINKTTGLRQYGGGGSKGGGGGGGGTTTQTVTKEEFPPEIRPYITDILERAQAQEEARQAVGYPVYPGPRIAAFTPEEKAAQAGVVSLVGSQTPTFDIAKGLTAASALEDTAPAIQARMSPYMQNVVDIQKREAERGAEARRQQLAAQGVAAGGYGGTREAFMQSELDRNLQQQLGDIQATGSQAAFQQAQQGLANLRQRQMGAGQQMAGLGTAQQGTAMKELGALAGIGEQQRQQQQKALDLGFQQFREEQTYPEASLQQYQSIIRGFPISPTTTQTQQAILPQPSLSQQLIGGAGALAGLGIAGQIPKLFAEGGSTFPDLSGDGKVTQKDILMGKGVIKKKSGKSISKGENVYLKKLMELIADKGKELTGMGDVKTSYDGGVVKMQPGGSLQNPLDKTNMFNPTFGPPIKIQGTGVPSFKDIFTNPKYFSKDDIIKVDTPGGPQFLIKDSTTGGTRPLTQMELDNLKYEDRSMLGRFGIEGTAIGEGLDYVKQKGEDISKAITQSDLTKQLTSTITDTAKGIGTFLRPPKGTLPGEASPKYFESAGTSIDNILQGAKDSIQRINEEDERKIIANQLQSAEEGDPGARLLVTKRTEKDLEELFKQRDALGEQIKSSENEPQVNVSQKTQMDILNKAIEEKQQLISKYSDTAYNPITRKISEVTEDIKDKFSKGVDKVKELNQRDDEVFKSLLEKFTKKEDEEQPVAETKPEEDTDKTKTETKNKQNKIAEEANKQEEKNINKGIQKYIEAGINPDDPNRDTLLAEAKDLVKNEENTKQAMDVSKNYIEDFMRRQEEESKSEYDKRRGFAIAQMGFAIMGGKRIVDAAADLMPNLSKIEQDNLERKNKQFERAVMIKDLEMKERGIELKEDELAAKRPMWKALADKYAESGIEAMSLEDINTLIPSLYRDPAGNEYTIEGSDKQNILRKAYSYNRENKLGLEESITKAIGEVVPNMDPDSSFWDSTKNLFKSLVGKK